MFGINRLIVYLKGKSQQQKNPRQEFLKNYHFSQALRDKLSNKHPQLNADELELVLSALRDYFACCQQAGQKMVSMPSQIVDDAWHEFILFTREYETFCKKTFGYFLHHTPAESMSSPTVAQSGIKLIWKLACCLENINSKTPKKLPLLFEIDKKLKIENGFYYELNCLDIQKNNDKKSKHGNYSTTPVTYCVTHISCGSSGDFGITEALSCGSGCGGGGID